MVDIRDNLKKIVDDRSLAQAAIARKANMTPAQFNQVLKKNRELKATELFAICDAIDIEPNSLRRI